jgi:hypothetical protein
LFHPHSWIGFTASDILLNYKLRSKIAPTLWEFDTKSITFLADLIIEEENLREEEIKECESTYELWSSKERKYTFEKRYVLLFSLLSVTTTSDFIFS